MHHFTWGALAACSIGAGLPFTRHRLPPLPHRPREVSLKVCHLRPIILAVVRSPFRLRVVGSSRLCGKRFYAASFEVPCRMGQPTGTSRSIPCYACCGLVDAHDRQALTLPPGDSGGSALRSASAETPPGVPGRGATGPLAGMTRSCQNAIVNTHGPFENAS